VNNSKYHFHLDYLEINISNLKILRDTCLKVIYESVEDSDFRNFKNLKD